MIFEISSIFLLAFEFSFLNAFPSQTQLLLPESIPGLIRNPIRIQEMEFLEETLIKSNINGSINNIVKLGDKNKTQLFTRLELDYNNWSLVTTSSSRSEDAIANISVTVILQSIDSEFEGIAVSFDCDNSIVGEIVNVTWYAIEKSANTVGLNIYFLPKDLGKAFIRVWMRPLINIPVGGDQISSGLLKFPYQTLKDQDLYWKNIAPNSQLINFQFGYKIKIKKPIYLKDKIFIAILSVFLIFITLGMGCELDIWIVFEILKKPIGPIIGFSCQFIIMPILSFVLGYYCPLMKEFGFGLLMIGCSPGGGSSNVWSYILGGDINLSMTMTMVSLIASFAMTPLLVFIFGRFFFSADQMKIPYIVIIRSLCLIIVPACVGIFIRWKRKDWAKKIVKLLKPFAGLFIIFLLTFGVWINLEIYRLIGIYPIVMPIGALLPWGSFLISALVAMLFQQSKKYIITIAIETMMQNIGVAIQILLDMPKPEGEIGTVMPLVVAIFTPIPLYIFLLVRLIRNKCRNKKSNQEIKVEKVEKDEKNEKDEQFGVLLNPPHV